MKSLIGFPTSFISYFATIFFVKIFIILLVEGLVPLFSLGLWGELTTFPLFFKIIQSFYVRKLEWIKIQSYHICHVSLVFGILDYYLLETELMYKFMHSGFMNTLQHKFS